MGLREQLQETSIFDGQNMICHSFPFHHANDTRLVIVDVWGILGRSGKPPRGRKPAAKTYEDLNVVLTRSNVWILQENSCSISSFSFALSLQYGQSQLEVWFVNHTNCSYWIIIYKPIVIGFIISL